MDSETSKVIVGFCLLAAGALIEIAGISAKTFYGVTGRILNPTSQEVDPRVGRVVMCFAGISAIAAGIFFIVSGWE